MKQLIAAAVAALFAAVTFTAAAQSTTPSDSPVADTQKAEKKGKKKKAKAAKKAKERKSQDASTPK
jgi:hypothetical protein